MRFLPEFDRLLGDELTKACNQRIELTKFWAKIITKINTQTVARAEIPDDVIERMAEWEYQMLRGLFLDDGRASYIERERSRALKAETFAWLGKIVVSAWRIPIYTTTTLPQPSRRVQRRKEVVLIATD